MGSEKFCLKWNDFENNISLAFRELRDDKDFFDVTLACANEQIQAHKVILSACSPFFRDILRRNAHPAPLLYLKGVKYTDLQSVLNFMYHGEVNVAQEDLNSFLAVAEDLKIKGLTQNQSGNQNSKKEVSKNPDPTSKRLRPKLTIPTFSNQTDNDVQEVVSIKSEPREGPVEAPIPSIQSVYQPQQHHSNTLAQADDQALAYPEDNYEDYGQYDDEQGEMAAQQTNAGVKGTEGYSFQEPGELLQFVKKDNYDMKFHCSLCDKFSHKYSSCTRNHVESIHFPSMFSYPCDECDSILSTKTGLNHHRSRIHTAKNKFCN